MNRYKLVTAGIDPNEGIKRFNNNKELYEKFLNSFPEDEHYAALLKNIAEKNVKEAFEAAHALKGISGNLSLNQLHTCIMPLVEELRRGSMEQVDELLPPVQKSYQAVIEALK